MQRYFSWGQRGDDGKSGAKQPGKSLITEEGAVMDLPGSITHPQGYASQTRAGSQQFSPLVVCTAQQPSESCHGTALPRGLLHYQYSPPPNLSHYL